MISNILSTITAVLTNIPRNPTKFFLIAALIFGLIICFRMPPLVGTDEFTHFPRVYQITDGTLWEQKLPQQQYGGTLPLNVSNMVNDYRDLSRKSNPQEFAHRLSYLNNTYKSQRRPGGPTTAIFTSVAMYPPWAYLPNAIGLMAAKMLHTPLIWYIYAARLSTLLVWICLTGCAMKLLPSGKWLLATVALLPTSLSQATTVGGDGLLTGLSWLTIGLVFAIFAKRVKLSWFVLILLGVVSFYLSIVKVGYWLIGAFAVIIPNYYFASRKIAIAWKLGLTGLIVGASAWFAQHTSNIADGTVLTPRLGVYINSHLQQQYILHHPFLFVTMALSQFFTKSYDTIYLGVVGILTNRLIYLPILVIGLLYLALFLSLVRSERMPSLMTHRRLLLTASSAAFLGTCIFISLAFYIGNTQVGSNTIFGIYGRYYLPILPLLLVIPMTRREDSTLEHTSAPAVLPTLSLIGLLYTIIGIGR